MSDQGKDRRSKEPAIGPHDDLAGETQTPIGHAPPGAAALPLFSVIGFGVLIGGLVSALKTR